MVRSAIKHFHLAIQINVSLKNDKKGILEGFLFHQIWIIHENWHFVNTATIRDMLAYHYLWLVIRVNKNMSSVGWDRVNHASLLKDRRWPARVYILQLFTDNSCILIWAKYSPTERKTIYIQSSNNWWISPRSWFQQSLQRKINIQSFEFLYIIFYSALA